MNWEIFHGSYTYRVVEEVLSLTASLLPGLLAGILISSALVAWWPLEWIRARHLSGGLGSILLMACLGAVSPFCSYLAIPIAAAFIVAGIHPAPVFAFLCSTPLMNPTLFVMTLTVFGWPMALARVAAAIGFGAVGGLVAARFSEPIFQFITKQSPDATRALRGPNRDRPFLQRWFYSFRHLGWFAAKYVLLGIVVAALVQELIPMRWIEIAVGRQYGYSVIVGALLGVPLYACGGGTIPLIQTLMNMGMSPEAALAFFIAGPALRVPILVALRMTAGSLITGGYIAFSLLWSLLAGVVYHIGAGF